MNLTSVLICLANCFVPASVVSKFATMSGSKKKTKEAHTPAPTPPPRSTFSSMSKKKLKAYIGEYKISSKPQIFTGKEQSRLFRGSEGEFEQFEYEQASAAWRSFFNDGENMLIPAFANHKLVVLFRYMQPTLSMMQLCTIYLFGWGKPEQAPH